MEKIQRLSPEFFIFFDLLLKDTVKLMYYEIVYLNNELLLNFN